jgi:transcription elongation factor GreA
MALNEVVMSAAGLKAAQDELEYLKTVRRKELAEEIKEARSHGDLSENSEYDEAKNTQGLVENRISELEQMLKNVKVIDETELSMDSVAVGTHVTIQEKNSSEKEEYDIVGRTEANPLSGKISDESPVGSALLGKEVGQSAEVLLPNGRTVTYTVLNITHSN